jgi:preprotein translocase subunit SecF
MEKAIQSDLFEEFQPKKIKKRYRNSFKRFLPYGFVNIRLSYESLFFSLIIVLMFSVVLFSLGIERGKRIKKDYFMQSNRVSTRDGQFRAEETPRTSVASEKDSPQLKPPQTKADLSTAGMVPKESIQSTGFNYTIQVLTYKDKISADRQVQQLIKKGYKPFIIHSGMFYAVCVGLYSSRETAKADLAILRRSYKDCFVRGIK